MSKQATQWDRLQLQGCSREKLRSRALDLRTALALASSDAIPHGEEALISWILSHQDSAMCSASRIPPAAMHYRQLGSSGLQVSAVGLGCFAFGGDKSSGAHLGASHVKVHAECWGAQDEADTFAAVRAALDSGINFFDNAEMYGDGYAEDVLGRALKASGRDRSEYIIATKVCESYLEPSLLRERLEQSLQRMQCEYIDLYQIHWHSRAAVRSDKYPDRPLDAEVPLDMTLYELDALRREGKIRHIGVCNFGVNDLRAALKTGGGDDLPLLLSPYLR